MITYAENGKLYVLGKSGGVSLFDGIPSFMKLSKNKRWYCCYIPETARIPDGLLLAKNIGASPI